MDNPPESSREENLPSLHPGSSNPCRFRPGWFFGILAAPGVLSLIMLSVVNDDYGQASLVVLLIGSVFAGLLCGIHFARSQRQLSHGVRWVVGIISVIGCAGGAFAIGMGGCALLINVW